MTLMKLAQLAGVSVGTVSKAFSGSREIGDETRERIFTLAKEQGCFDKYYKNPRKRPLIALVFPEPESEFYGRMIGVFERVLNERGADTVIAFSRFDAEREAELFREFAYGMRVNGVIVVGSGSLIRNPENIPLITFSNQEYRNTNADVVRINFDGAIETLLQTVKDFGHTEIGFLGERLTKGKEQSFRKALRKIGLRVSDESIYESDKRFMEAGEDGMRALIARGCLPSVIVASYDQIAYGAMKIAQAEGYRVPEDISFVGMDDISSTPYLGVPLASLHVDFEEACREIAELIFKRMDVRYYRERNRIVVPVKVVVRESLGRIGQ